MLNIHLIKILETLLQKEMQGAGEAAELSTDDAIDAIIAELRNEDME